MIQDSMMNNMNCLYGSKWIYSIVKLKKQSAGLKVSKSVMGWKVNQRVNGEKENTEENLSWKTVQQVHLKSIKGWRAATTYKCAKK